MDTKRTLNFYEIAKEGGVNLDECRVIGLGRQLEKR